MWVIIAISSYFFTALANTIDKIVVSKFIPKPVIYAFYVGILGVLSLVLIPFGVSLPTFGVLVAALIAGMGFVTSLFLMYSGLVRGETTRVVPILHGTIPIATFIFAYIFLHERLAITHLIAFAFLFVGLVIISYHKNEKKRKVQNYAFLWYALASGIVFGATYTISKFVYTNQEFISGFFWMRMGAFLGALILFSIPKNRKAIIDDFKGSKAKKGSVVLANQLLGGIGFVTLDYAISIASVTLVQSLQGILYVFVFIIVNVMAIWVPELKEKITPGIIVQKLAAMCFIAVGLYFLAQ
jgi:drug/metabolite transporter (DMT)-like permease